MTAGGVNASAGIPIVFGLALGAAGFLLPDVMLRAEAARYRRDFNAQLAVYLDLVVVLLAGGRGVDGALTAAATMGDSSAFMRIRRTLAAAQLNRESPWRALDRLANTLEITALAELAASVTLAGESGARVRESLAAKAESIRARLLSQAEAEAHRRSETMTAPVVMMLTGFVMLIGFPAVYALMTF
jgi:Flp pilus assembly protein TadB